MRALTHSEIHRATWVAHSSGVPQILENELRKGRRGRKIRRGLYEQFIIGALLTVSHDHLFVVSDIHDTLTKAMPREQQWELGILQPPRRRGGKPSQLSRDQLYLVTQRISKFLDFTPEAAPDLSDDERKRREAVVHDIMNRLIHATLPIEPQDGMFALDASGWWAWARGVRTRPSLDELIEEHETLDIADEDADDLTEALDEATTIDLAGVNEEDLKVETSHDPDARWCLKTGKEKRFQVFFGYALHALVRVTGPNDMGLPLVEHLAVTASTSDVVDVSLRLVDEINDRYQQNPEDPGLVTDLLTDRHYNYKTVSRWLDQLRKRNIKQHIDLRKDQHGATDYNGAKMIDGWPHCPATPERLEIIERPGVFATKEEIEEFHDKIDERQQYAAMRLSQDTKKGCARYRCPAKEGSIGCPHVEGTVEAAVSLGQPTIQNPPDLEATPIKLCQQGSVTIHKEDTANSTSPTTGEAESGRKSTDYEPTSKDSSEASRTPAPKPSAEATTDSSDSPTSPSSPQSAQQPATSDSSAKTPKNSETSATNTSSSTKTKKISESNSSPRTRRTKSMRDTPAQRHSPSSPANRKQHKARIVEARGSSTGVA